MITGKQIVDAQKKAEEAQAEANRLSKEFNELPHSDQRRVVEEMIEYLTGES